MRSCSRSEAGVCATVRLGFGEAPERVGPGVWKREMSPQPDSAVAAHSTAVAAQRRREFHPICRFAIPVTKAALLLGTRPPKKGRAMIAAAGPSGRTRALVRPKQFELPHPVQFKSRSGPHFDDAANSNPSI